MKKKSDRGSHWLNTSFVGAALFAMVPGVVLAEEKMEEVVVTGSFIRGTPIDAESPVTILTRDGLQKQGAPTMVEMVRRLSVSSGVDGESNQFQSNATEGTANVNIRGLGPQRTLVLLNGKRQVGVPANLPAGRFVDINNFPSIAVQRVEVLKEGAAATYGSDAIGGVVNFLTRKNFEGAEISVGHQEIEDSDGFQTIGLILGKEFGGFNVVTSIGYEERNALSMRDRSFANEPYAVNPQGGWSSIGNPGVFFDPANAGSSFSALSGAFPANVAGVKDPNCELLGGVDQSLFCRFRYTDFDNLIENEERLQWFTEVNGNITDNVNFHGEFLYSTIDVPDWKTSPSYPPQALFGDIQSVPADHPGLLDMAIDFPEFQPFIDSGRGATFYGRLQGVGADAGRIASREYETMRIAGAFQGTFDNDIGWDLGLTYSSSESDLVGVDAQIGRTKLAFSGFGGDSCAATLDNAGDFVLNGATAGQGGCLYYNPFSNSIAASQAQLTRGAVNPDYNPAVANSAEVLDYLDDSSNTHGESSLFVLDLVFQGEMFDGQAAWAGGYQYRLTDVTSMPDNLNNLAINPCNFVGQTDCTAQTGLRSFLSGGRAVDASQDVHSLFLENALHISEDLDLQVAVRYVDYGDSDTLDPKVSVRYAMHDKVTLRGSVQTTFRGPDIDSLSPNTSTALSFVGPAAAFKAIDYVGNPDLNPEEAFTYNLGIIVNPTDNLTFTFDYWSYDFDNPIVTEDFNALVSAYSAGGAAKEAVQAQIFCTGGTNDGACAASAIERIVSNTINGPAVTTNGFDIFGEYTTEVGSGNLALGFDFSHTLEYTTEAYIKGDTQVAAAFDAAGGLNAGNAVRPLPDLKGRTFAEYNMGVNNFLLYANYLAEYEDQRFAGVNVDSQTTWDFHYQVQLLDDSLKLTASAINFTDEEPPLARVDLNYDGYTHNAFGRMFKLGIQYTLAGG
jgi:outer membrane receptor protein involved in Fe transport